MLRYLSRFRWLHVAVNALCVTIGVAPVFAAVSNTPVFVQIPSAAVVNSSGSNSVAIYTGGQLGGTVASKCIGAWATSTNTAVHTLFLTMIQTNTQTIESVVIPALSGDSTTAPPINLMSPANWPGLPVDSDGNAYFYLKSGATINFYTDSSTASASVSVGMICTDF